MQQQASAQVITQEQIKAYLCYLREQEKAKHTQEKYSRDLQALYRFLPQGLCTKEKLLCWKEYLCEQFATSTVNSMLAAANGFFRFLNWHHLRLKPLKMQRTLFCQEEKELTKSEYQRLVHTAQDSRNKRLALVIQTICATGIRVSELRFITTRAVESGRAEVICKGKRRMVFLPKPLCKQLKQYIKQQKQTSGPVFVTRSGKPLDRSNIWRDMKRLCRLAQVLPEKVFPHNLRHLFARTYYSREKDISRLADLLGHTSVTTTRIYMVESGTIHARHVERLGLIIT
ncbi:tyrosine-type recombinase/integrase [uncultured Allofournierella sp.]|uniref:tyrosine-type recombinase/integrase n=1 Tax=uncultured Allofournierella sp. TaxID=1940258 RepID=UPI003752744F